MHGVVDHPKPYPGTDGVAVAVPAVDEDGDVVVHVQEGELGLAQHNEEGVEELRELGEGEEEGPQPRPHRADVGTGVAHGVSPPAKVDHAERRNVDAYDGVEAEHAECRAPHAQGSAEVKGLAGLHVLPPCED